MLSRIRGCGRQMRLWWRIVVLLLIRGLTGEIMRRIEQLLCRGRSMAQSSGWGQSGREAVCLVGWALSRKGFLEPYVDMRHIDLPLCRLIDGKGHCVKRRGRRRRVTA